MMTNQKGIKLAQDLTMEYIRQNKLLCCAKSDIPKQIDYIVEIENIISNCVEKRLKDFEAL